MNHRVFSFVGIFVVAAAVLLVGRLSFSAEVSAAPPDDLLAYSTGFNALTDQPPESLNTADLINLAFANGEIDRDTANLYLMYAINGEGDVPKQYQSDVLWDATATMRQLSKTLDQMQSRSAQRAIDHFLTGACESSNSSLTTIHNSTNFHIEYSTISVGLTIDDYVTSLETAWTKEVDQFGWAAPPVGPNPPPGNRYHVRIDTLNGTVVGFVYHLGDHGGLVGDNPNTAWDDVDAYASCMVLRNDYTNISFNPQALLNATTSHELVHSIQFGYGILTGDNATEDAFVEGAASWMEDEVFDNANDNYGYLWPSFDMCMGEYTYNPYRYWITWRGLTERYGSGTPGGSEQVWQDYMESVSQNSTDNSLSALNAALVNQGTTLADAFHAYAIAVKHNKTCGGNHTYPYCFEEGANYVSVTGEPAVHGQIDNIGEAYSGSIQDNYAINWVSLPTDTPPYTLTVINNSPTAELQLSVVCDVGDIMFGQGNSAVISGHQTVGLSDYDPTGCNTVTLIVTNQRQTAADPSTCTAHNYMVWTTEDKYEHIFMPIIYK